VGTQEIGLRICEPYRGEGGRGVESAGEQHGSGLEANCKYEFLPSILDQVARDSDGVWAENAGFRIGR
jgi:hypothetical protein